MAFAIINVMTDSADKLKLIGDGTRFRILQFLADPVLSCCSREDGVCACDLEEFLGLSQPTVSHHMKQLVAAGVVTAERRGTWVYYELVPSALRQLAAQLDVLATAAEDVPSRVEPGPV